jgi:hypothetical protein
MLTSLLWQLVHSEFAVSLEGTLPVSGTGKVLRPGARIARAGTCCGRAGCWSEASPAGVAGVSRGAASAGRSPRGRGLADGTAPSTIARKVGVGYKTLARTAENKKESPA